MSEIASASEASSASIGRAAAAIEGAAATGRYEAVLVGPSEGDRERYVQLRDRISALQARPIARVVFGRQLRRLRREIGQIPLELKWRDFINNVVTTEGKNALLTHGFKASALTQTLVMGIVESTGFTSYNATNTAANITAAGGGSPTNGWNEATTSQCAARGSPSMGTASAGSLATSSAVAFSMLTTATIKGCFMLMKSTAGVAPSTTTGNTSGALYSVGAFSAGDRSVVNGDTLNVSWTGTLT